MKITPQRIGEVIRQIEICLGVAPTKRTNQHFNIDRAIACLESLREQVVTEIETPIEIIGLDFSTIQALEKAGIETAEQLQRMTTAQIMQISGIDTLRCGEIIMAMEICRDWDDEPDKVF